MKDAKSKERQEFEDWYLEDGGDNRSVVHDGCAYVYQHTQISWESWEASAIRNANDTINFTKIPTSADVWDAIRAHHSRDLVVFSTSSHTHKDKYGHSYKFTATIQYGIDVSGLPLICAETTRNKNDIEEVTEYWLYITKKTPLGDDNE